jgi:RNA polymerase sigma factor (sigma-70 family)
MVNASLNGVLRHLRGVREMHALAESTDAQLLERFNSYREEAAFAALMRRHGPMVLSVSQRVLHQRQDAEDVFQATFLLLARKAGAIRKQSSVSSWLHGVAHRLALKARTRAARRRANEKRAADSRPLNARADAWQEVQAVLDAALDELPERYRAPLVLCCLEEKTLAEAARILGRPVATVGTQLARGRKLLRERFAQRGLTLTASGVASLLLASAAPAAGMTPLARATVQSALAIASGQPAATICSAPVAKLLDGGLRTMFLGKLKIAAGLLAAVSIVSAACSLAWPTPPSQETNATAAKPEQAPANAKQQLDKDAVAYSGRVGGPDGKPIVGAKVYYYFQTRANEPTPVRATTDDDGKFTFALTPRDVPNSADAVNSDARKAGFVVVKADGFAFAWRSRMKLTTDLQFRLARDDMPIQGRILDLQGKPIAGARVTVLGAAESGKDDLADFLKALEDRLPFYSAMSQHLSNYMHSPFIGRREVNLLPGVQTDADGRFRIDGFAREQLVELRVEGPTIEKKEFYVLTRAKPDAAPNLLTPAFSKGEMYGPSGNAHVRWNGFDYAAAPGQAVAGTVRDEKTKTPLPGAIVESYVLAGTNLSQNTVYHSVADEQGRYHFTGLPRGKGNRIRIRPAKDQPYIPLVVDVPEKEALAEATVDVGLTRGVFVDVTAKDKATGQPVPGSVSYFLFPDKFDPDMPFFPGPFHDSYDNFMAIRNDGAFRFVAVPRKAILAFRTDWNKYPIAREADTMQLPSGMSSSNFQAFANLHPKVGDEPAKIDFVLDTGGVTKVRVVGPDGKLLPGTMAAGLRHDWFSDADWPGLAKSAEFTALGLDPKHPRLLCFTHAEKKLAGSVVVRGDEKATVTVKLQPWASVKGRLLDADGQPIKNTSLWFTELPPLRPGSYRSLDVGLHLVARIAGQPNPDPQTDADGRFQVDGLIPGLKYNLAWAEFAFSFDKHQWKGLVFSNLVLQPAETKDLGDVTLKPFPKK